MPQQFIPFHPTETISLVASSGMPRNASSLLSSRIKLIASDRFFRHSSFVLPCPFAPGISGQYAMNQSPSRSTIAVNSLCIVFTPMFLYYHRFLLPVKSPILANSLVLFFPTMTSRRGLPQSGLEIMWQYIVGYLLVHQSKSSVGPFVKGGAEIEFSLPLHHVQGFGSPK